MKKSKVRWGGLRAGAGRGYKWKHGLTKSVRLPVALVDEILQVARYMDSNEGQLPVFAPPVIISGHPSRDLSPEELKEFFVKQNTQKAVEELIYADESELVGDTTFKDLSDSLVAGFIDFEQFFELQDQKRYDSYFKDS